MKEKRLLFTCSCFKTDDVSGLKPLTYSLELLLYPKLNFRCEVTLYMRSYLKHADSSKGLSDPRGHEGVNFGNLQSLSSYWL